MSDKNILVQATHVKKWFPIKKWFFEKQNYVKADLIYRMRHVRRYLIKLKRL